MKASSFCVRKYFWISPPGPSPEGEMKELGLHGSDAKQDHADDDESEVNGFVAQIFFVKDECGKAERDEDTGSSDHGDDSDHGAVEA